MTDETQANPRIARVVNLIESQTPYRRRYRGVERDGLYFIINQRKIDAGVEVFYYGMKSLKSHDPQNTFLELVGRLLFQAFPVDNQVQRITRSDATGDLKGFIVYPY